MFSFCFVLFCFLTSNIFIHSAVTGEGIPQLAHALRIMVSAMKDNKPVSNSDFKGDSSDEEMKEESHDPNASR